MTNSRTPLYVILHDIRSTYNVGAIFRTADGAGVDCMYLTGYTPAPVDRFGRTRTDIAKASLGAEDTVRWEQCEDLPELITRLKAEGVRVVAVEQDARSVPYATLSNDVPTALLFGAEVTGLPKEILDQCDVIAEIPMFGAKESLNVSVAAGIALYRFRTHTP